MTVLSPPRPDHFRTWLEDILRQEQQKRRAALGLSFAAVLIIAGAGGIWAARLALPPPPAAGPPPAAIAVDLAPMPVSAPTPAQTVPEGPQQALAQSESEPEPVTPPEVTAPLSPAQNPPVPVPKEEKKLLRKKPLHKQVQHVSTSVPAEQPPAPETTSPRRWQPPPSQAQAAPSHGAPSSSHAHDKANWQGELLARLERFKRYPAVSQHNRDEGTVMLRFRMDRQGHVLSASVAKGSGFEALDQETLALVHRAESLPSPPDTVPGETVSLTVPVEFYLDTDR
ncbi:energy transducer TonB [Acetobacter sp. AN02]|uniref:energy transducer TonB n=1 Tax=Acetobacter sp. AN02 TaxID=2894186 RepID=UPI00243443E7|nr:energy transducer TonB [Acetobacter sp. AN02]MDG6095416.1 energy transducer TonB [Acetobacter sp. AN02]